MIIKGYIAADKDNSLWFHYIKPERQHHNFISDDKSFEIWDEDFPEFKNLTWEDAPIEVKFSINKIKEMNHGKI